LIVFFRVADQACLLTRARDLGVVEQRNQEDPSDDPERGRKQETSQVLQRGDLTREDAYQDLRSAGYTVN